MPSNPPDPIPAIEALIQACELGQPFTVAAHVRDARAALLTLRAQQEEHEPGPHSKVRAYLCRLAKLVTPVGSLQTIRRDGDDGEIRYQLFADTDPDGVQIGYIDSTRHDAEFVAACLAQAPLFDELLGTDLVALREAHAKLQEEHERLKARLDAEWQGELERRVSFACVMDSIDSRQLQETIEELVIWHIRRADHAEAEVARLTQELATLRERQAECAPHNHQWEPRGDGKPPACGRCHRLAWDEPEAIPSALTLADYEAREAELRRQLAAADHAGRALGSVVRSLEQQLAAQPSEADILTLWEETEPDSFPEALHQLFTREAPKTPVVSSPAVR